MTYLIPRRSMVGALVALPVGLFIVYCSSSSDNTTPGAAPQHVGTQTIYTSSSTNSHTHTFAIDDSSFASPPAAGLNGSTSVEAGHSHTVAISMAALQQMVAGQSVQITSGDTGGHTHVFPFVKIA